MGSHAEGNTLPPQHQETQPGMTAPMEPQPSDEMRDYVGTGKFLGRSIIVTGGDSGIGRAIAVGFAKEGANIVIVYLSEHADVQKSKELIEEAGGQALLIEADVGDAAACEDIAKRTIHAFGRIDVLCNNAGEQHPAESLGDITDAQLRQTFQSNIFGMFYLTRAVLPHLQGGASIINTASVTAYAGNPKLIDYSSTKGAIVSFTRSLAIDLAAKNIRVNAVAPGPIWTPLIPSTFPAEEVASFGADVPLGRPGQPDEVAPAYIFLASNDASYITGQTLHVNGGKIVNG